MTLFIEGIAQSSEDAVAISAGLQRIQLVVNLSEGGLSPPIQLVSAVLESAKVPVRVMVRPKSSSFVYTADQLHSMCEQLYALGKIDHPLLEGVVSGCLNSENEIDLTALKKLIHAVPPHLKVTFHKAFD